MNNHNDETGCFGNYNTDLKLCAFCEVAVECYHRSDVGEELSQGHPGRQPVKIQTQLPITKNTAYNQSLELNKQWTKKRKMLSDH